MPAKADTCCFPLSAAPRVAFSLRTATLLAVITLLAIGSSYAFGEHIAISAKLAAGKAGVAYNSAISISGGTAPYTFSLQSGALPPGLSLNSSNGEIAGTPTAAGTYAFSVLVTDTSSDRGDKNLSLFVANSSGIHVSVSPSSATVSSASSQQFTAYVSGTSNSAVTWSATAGSINSSGMFVAPNVSANTSVTVTATSAADSTKKASAAVTVTAQSGPTITTTYLSPATATVAYTQALNATGGTKPYSWNIASGSLPSGVTLSSAGVLGGTTSTTGNFTFSARVTDANSHSDTQSLTLQVNPASGSYDGPAELPRVYLQTNLVNTPAPGGTIYLAAGGNLQTALNNANCGDTIQLQAGATFAGKFILPAKACDDAHWIIIRSSAPDTSLPSEGTRLTPCYAGVASLPGRPSFNCASTSNVLPKIVYSGLAGDGPIEFASGANHYRFLGLEITRAPGANLSALMSVVTGATADKIVVDRCWVHGDTHADTDAGVVLTNTTNVAVVDSFFTDFHCAASCTDAKTIGGGNSNTPGGPYKIVNNFLEASGESVIFGGGASTTTPADIEIRRNHMFKPMIWKKGQPGFVGNASGLPFIVKNHFELKNAQRVLFEANILENAWGGFTQHGFSILLTPKNQAKGTTLNLCPTCKVTDVTVRYSTISHVGGGFEVSTGVNGNGAQAAAGARFSIHDVTVDDVNATTYIGGGTFMQVANTWLTNPLNSVLVNHVTAFADANSHLLASRNDISNPPMWGFVFTNNIVLSTRYPVWNMGGGSTSCAYSDVPITIVATCFKTYAFTNNAIIAVPSAFGPSLWPSGNYYPATASNVGFANYNNANGGNYKLLSSSPYANAGSDGKDLGADITTLQAAIAGVY